MLIECSTLNILLNFCSILVDENTGLLKDLNVKSVIISDALQHDDNNPEAVTNFENYQVDNIGLLTNAIEKLRSHGKLSTY